MIVFSRAEKSVGTGALSPNSSLASLLILSQSIMANDLSSNGGRAATRTDKTPIVRFAETQSAIARIRLIAIVSDQLATNEHVLLQPTAWAGQQLPIMCKYPKCCGLITRCFQLLRQSQNFGRYLMLVHNILPGLHDFQISSLGKPFTIFIVSRLTVITRMNSSSGYLGLCMVSMAQSLASLTMPLSLSVFTHWRSTTQSSAGLPFTTYS